MRRSYTIPKKKLEFGGDLPEYQDQQYVESQKQAGLLGAIPVWGQFAKIGQAIGSQTMDKHGIYKSRAAGVVDNIVNPSTWVQNLKDVFKKPTFSGIANELTLGIFGQSATQKRRKAEMAAQKTAWQNKQNQIGGTAYANEQMAQYSGNQPKAMFRFGGQSTKPRVIKGGRLEKISTSAVQVKGNEPSKRDGVETQTAKLDHNEVVDRQNRVYSDQLRHTDGRSIAEHAKTIEQRRVVNPEQADKDLDDLYTFQESQKSPVMRINRAHSTAYQNPKAITIAPADAKQHLSGGGEIPPGRLKIRKNSSAASARPSLNGAAVTSYDTKIMNSELRQSHPAHIPHASGDRLTPVKDRVNPLRRPRLSLGGMLDPTTPPDTSSPMMTKKLQPMGRTRMGLRLPPKGVVKEPETPLTNIPNKAGKPPKIRNFTRSGYR